MAIDTIGIIGSGLMGTGIAQVCAASGLKVIVRDIDQAALTRSTQSIADSLTKLVARQKLTEDVKTAALAAITTTTDAARLAAADFVIEAATENLGLKQKILARSRASQSRRRSSRPTPRQSRSPSSPRR